MLDEPDAWCFADRQLMELWIRGSRIMAKKKSGINISKSNAGKLRRAAGVKKGQKIPAKKLDQLAKSKNPTTRKRAVFARNAGKWSNTGGKKKK